MMIALKDLVLYLDSLLEAAKFRDYCPNGLQVEGRSEINTLVTGVTANQALFDAAMQYNADCMLVHHGFFWKGESPCITGIKYQRLRKLLASGMSLIAYHLPLDAHPTLGNNVQLAQRLSIDHVDIFEVEPGLRLGYKGKLQNAMSGQQFKDFLAKALAREPFHIPGLQPTISTVAWCTGAAQDYFPLALDHEIDAFITGEISERTFHIARESGTHFYAAGHHATERYGVAALGEHLAKHFNLTHHFIDIDNPI